MLKEKKQDNVIKISSYQKKNKKNIMIILIVIITALLAVFIWNNFISDNPYRGLEIEESQNISYDISQIKETNAFDLVAQIEKAAFDNSPTLLFLYTSWCSVCKKQLPVINEIARKFQNTDLKVIIVVIDKDLTKEKAISSLESLNKVYFQGQYILNRNGLKELLRDKSINYKNVIPYTAIIGRDSKIIDQFSGYKKLEFFERKIMKSLVRKDGN